MKKYNILLVDDHTIMLDGITHILKNVEFIGSIRTATSSDDALEILNTQEIDIAVLDISIGEIGGLELLKIIRDKYVDIKVLMLSMFNDIEHISEAIGSGANGYVTKMKAGDCIILALQTILKGHSFYSRDINEKIRNFIRHTNILRKPKQEYELSDSDKELLKYLTSGKTMREIAEKMNLSHRTIESRMKNLMIKTKAENRIMLVVKAITEGLIDLT